jgi:hypothetical protein
VIAITIFIVYNLLLAQNCHVLLSADISLFPYISMRVMRRNAIGVVSTGCTFRGSPARTPFGVHL